MFACKPMLFPSSPESNSFSNVWYYKYKCPTRLWCHLYKLYRLW